MVRLVAVHGGQEPQQLFLELNLSDSQNLPHLEILPVEKLVLHEFHDAQRTPPIIKALRESWILRNPPIVMPLEDGSDRYMVLDGANRTTALQEMGIPHIIAQVVRASDPGIELNPWNHVVWGVSPETLLEWAASVEDLTLQSSVEERLFRDLLDIHSLALIKLADGRVYTAGAQTLDPLKRVEILNALVQSYADQTSMDRTNDYDISALRDLYSNLSGLIFLPPFRLEEVLFLASKGRLMPAGSTRFTISGRALHINFPLGILNSPQSLSKKNDQLQEWLQKSLAQKRVRYYAEPIFMFDE